MKSVGPRFWEKKYVLDVRIWLIIGLGLMMLFYILEGDDDNCSVVLFGQLQINLEASFNRQLALYFDCSTVFLLWI